MQIIPVIDILKGQVVRAYCGRRDDYRPIRSTLCSSADPVAVVQAFLALHSFAIIYLADLDAITGRGDNDDLVAALCRLFPDTEFWIDRGDRDGMDNGPVPVLGAETGLTPGELKKSLTRQPDLILSLDFDGNGFMGNAALLADSDAWPRRCIVMSLARVGGGNGPDLDRLASLRQRAPGHDYYVAGGVRNARDLEQARRAGAAGALLASALHDGHITAEMLHQYDALIY